MSGYKKVLEAKKKLADTKKKKVPYFALGGVVGDAWHGVTTGTNAGSWDKAGQTLDRWSGGGAKVGLGRAGDTLAGVDPTAKMAQGSHVNSLPNLATPPTLVNPLTQLGQMNGQGISANLGTADAAGMNQMNMGNGLMGMGNNALTQQMAAAGQLDHVFGSQGQLASALQQQAMGQGGPGQQLAQSMLGQATQNNIAQNAGMMASARGINPALAARMAGQNAAQMNQQAAMQGTQLGLQSQLNAQQQLGGLYGQMGQTVGTAGGLYGNAANLGIGAGTNLLNTGRGQDIESSLGGANVALGNQGQQLGSFGQFQGQQLQGALGAQGIDADIAGKELAARTSQSGAMTGAGAALGAAAITAMAASRGAVVPGRAPYRGDDSRNDVVDAKVSPGEIVLPRSITTHPDAPKLAAEFVRKVLAGKGPKPKFKPKFDEGGEVQDPETQDVSSGGSEDSGDPGMQRADLSNSGPNDSDVLSNVLLGGKGGSWVGTMSDNFVDMTKKLGDKYTDFVADHPDQFGLYGQHVASERAKASAVDSPNASDSGAIAVGTPQLPTNKVDQNYNTQALPQVGQKPGADPFAGVGDAYSKAFGQEQAGISGATKASQDEAATQTAAYADYLQKSKETNERYQAKLADLDKENASLTQEYMNGKIDPQRVWHNMGTGSKILAAIAVGLGGYSSGLTGGPNQALGIINKMIDSDIDAQKADLGKKQTMLSMNLQKYGRLDAAYAATKAQMSSLLQGQVMQAATKAGGDKAAANGQMLTGQLGLQKAQMQHQVAALQAFNNMGQGGEGDIGQKIRLGIASGVTPKELVPSLMKEYGEYNKLKNSLGAVQTAFEKVRSLQNIGSRMLNPVQSKTQIDATKKIYSAQLAKDLEGRATPQDIESIMDNFPDLFDKPETVTQKLQNLSNSIKSKFSFSTLEPYLPKNDPLTTPTMMPQGARLLQAGNG